MDSTALGRLSDDLLWDVYTPRFWNLSRTPPARDAERHLFERAFLDVYYAGATHAA